MSRRKTRFTRMSRRKARSGTRKRKGGFLGAFLGKFNPSNWGKKVDPNAPATGAATATGAADAKAAADANAVAVPPVAPPATANAVTGTAQNKPFWKIWSGGARKTRHRRRRHRK